MIKIKKEIKEILNYLKKKENTRRIKCITIEESKQLLDYIKNIEQNDKEWSMIFDTFSKRPYAHKYLEEKKKELNNNKIIGLDSEMIYKDYYDLKLRIEKAIEYIKDEWYELNTRDIEHCISLNKDIRIDLLNILKGDKDE